MLSSRRGLSQMAIIQCLLPQANRRNSSATHQFTTWRRTILHSLSSPPSYALEGSKQYTLPAMATRAPELIIPRVSTSGPAFDFIHEGGDGQCIPELIKIASDPRQLVASQQIAARRLLDYDGEVYPSDGCAITLSVLLQESGIRVPDIYLTFELGGILRRKRNWQIGPVGQQMPGDVGSTCGPKPHHGTDHIYLVLSVLNMVEMVVADNQASAPNFRSASGAGGRSSHKFLFARGKIAAYSTTGADCRISDSCTHSG